MGWSGQERYLAAPTEDWLVDGQVSGSLKTYGPLAVSAIILAEQEKHDSLTLAFLLSLQSL